MSELLWYGESQIFCPKTKNFKFAVDQKYGESQIFCPKTKNFKFAVDQNIWSGQLKSQGHLYKLSSSLSIEIACCGKRCSPPFKIKLTGKIRKLIAVSGFVDL